MPGMNPPMRRPGAGQPTIPPPMTMPGAPASSVKVNYITHAITVDFRGGEEVLHGRRPNSRKLTAVGDILLLDSDGNLVLHNELDDEPACKQLDPPKTDEAGGQTDPMRPQPKGLGDFAGEGSKKAKPPKAPPKPKR
jgi:hypothetical protein